MRMESFRQTNQTQYWLTRSRHENSCRKIGKFSKKKSHEIHYVIANGGDGKPNSKIDLPSQKGRSRFDFPLFSCSFPPSNFPSPLHPCLLVGNCDPHKKTTTIYFILFHFSTQASHARLLSTPLSKLIHPRLLSANDCLVQKLHCWRFKVDRLFSPRNLRLRQIQHGIDCEFSFIRGIPF